MARNGSINLPSNATSPLNLLASKYFAYIDFGPFDWVHANAAGHWANNKSRIFHYGRKREEDVKGGRDKMGTNVPLLRNNVIKHMNRDRSWKLIKISILKSISMHDISSAIPVVLFFSFFTRINHSNIRSIRARF